MGLFREFYSCCVRLTKCCSRVIFSFLVTYSARLIFHFCVADLKATQIVPTQPAPLFGRRIYFQNVRAFIFLKGYFLFPLRRQGNNKKKKKKLLLFILVLNLLSTSSPLSFNLGNCFCTQ